MKTFFKCTVSALAVSAVVVLALLSGGCNKEPEIPQKQESSELLGRWYLEFYEEDLGGECRIGYIFKENGELTMDISCSDEQGSLSLLWHTDGDKLYTLCIEEEEFYKETDAEWPYVKYIVSDNVLNFYGEDGEVVSFTRIR